MQYAAPGLAVVLAFTHRVEAMRTLLGELLPHLPRRFYAHLSPGLVEALSGAYRPEPGGEYRRMVLADADKALAADISQTFRIEPGRVDEVSAFYAEAYPGNWFDPAMLKTDQYFGVRRNKKLVAVAGVHVYSAAYKVAALGNIATHPDVRGQGLGTAVTAAVCRSLLGSCQVIGLNVKADNAAAIACYRKLGFTAHATFEELMFS
jgi:ribosomal protein S18 acetylase RimI-like enzyme